MTGLVFQLGISKAWTQDEALDLAEEATQKSRRSKDFSPRDLSKTITLKLVLEKGLRENINEKVRGLQRTIVKINWRDAWESFWFPNVKLYLNSSKQKIHRVWEGPSVAANRRGNLHTGTGNFGLSLGDYTVFNWGKDYSRYLNHELTFDRSTAFLDEQRRDLKHKLIEQYFSLAKAKKSENIFKEQLKHATFIYRLARERASLKKIKKQEYYEARAEYLLTQTEYHQARLDAVEQDEKMANLVGDNLSTSYFINEYLGFKKVKVLLKDVISFSLSKNTDLLNQKTSMKILQREYDIALKDSLPLPKFSINFGTYNYNWNRDGLNSNYSTSDTTGHIDLVASVNATWNIVGEGGLFNTRSTYRSFLEKRIEEEKFYDVRRKVELRVRSLYKKIMHLENKIDIEGLRLENAQKNFDATLDNYVEGKARFDELKDSLIDLKSSEIELEKTKFLHLSKKLALAGGMGQEDFPGENFETLAIPYEK